MLNRYHIERTSYTATPYCTACEESVARFLITHTHDRRGELTPGSYDTTRLLCLDCARYDLAMLDKAWQGEVRFTLQGVEKAHPWGRADRWLTGAH